MVFERKLERVEDGRRIEGQKNGGGGSTGLRGLDSFKWKLTRGGLLYSSSSGSVPSDGGLVPESSELIKNVFPTCANQLKAPAATFVYQ